MLLNGHTGSIYAGEAPVKRIYAGTHLIWDAAEPTNPTPPPLPEPPADYSVTVASGGDIQAAMDAAQTWFLANRTLPVNFANPSTMATVQLVASGLYVLNDALKTRTGVRVVGLGSGNTRPTIRAGSTGHLVNCNTSGGGYTGKTDWQFKNIIFDCNNFSGGMSIVHTKRFSVEGCKFRRMGGKKHYIEANSSGGTKSVGTYNVQIKSCEFTEMLRNPTNEFDRRAEDECIQIDYSFPGAAHNTMNDGTVTNNVLISGCTFYRVPRAIGSHRFQTESGDASPDALHGNILVEGNKFIEVNPNTYGDGGNSVGSEGAVRAYCWSTVTIRNNLFDSCFQPINFHIPPDAPARVGNPSDIVVTGNTIRNPSRHGIYGKSSHSTLKFNRVTIEKNVADAVWPKSGAYLAGVNDTVGNVYIRYNVFKPTSLGLTKEIAYNKYRSANSTNVDGVVIAGNKVSDGSTSNS